MSFTTYIFCIAVLSGARANPLSQTVCETVPNLYPLLGSPLPPLPAPLPAPLPNIGSTTVCETSPSFLGLGLGYQLPYNYGYYPYSCPRYPMPYPIGDNLGYPYQNHQVPTTTVCETSPNVMGVLPLPNVPSVGTTTVCETSPNVVSFLPFPNVQIPNVATTMVCETTPSMLPYNCPLPYPGLLPGYSPYGMPFL